jgi:preprotein translocase subunit SecG
MFGAVGPSNFLGKLTAVIAALFLILNLAQAVLLKMKIQKLYLVKMKSRKQLKLLKYLLSKLFNS